MLPFSWRAVDRGKLFGIWLLGLDSNQQASG